MKKAVILLNLGGPDSIFSIKPFLFNLFNDKSIIDIKQPFRYFLAKYISYKRLSTAKKIYSYIGGKSPILEETKQQAKELEKCLGDEYKVFISMRYWKPFIEDIVQEIDKYKPEKVVVLPLYPQYSTATSLSSIKTCIKKIKYPKQIVCCYYNHPSFIESHYSLIMENYEKASKFGKPRILFSAHGLPISIIKKGDPYEWQINNTANLLVKRINISGLDWKVCYQSKVGKKEWLSPSTELEIVKARKNKVPLVIIPISFVSEHSETLVELDIEYKNLAGSSPYFRVPTLSVNHHFIKSLLEVCTTEKCQNECPKKYKMCWRNLIDS